MPNTALDRQAVSWIATVVRRAAYRMSRDSREHSNHEISTDQMTEFAGAGPSWEDDLVDRLDT